VMHLPRAHSIEALGHVDWTRTAGVLMSEVDPDTCEVLPDAVREAVLAWASSTNTPVIRDDSVTALGRIPEVGFDASFTVFGSAYGGGLPFGAVASHVNPRLMSDWVNQTDGCVSVTAAGHFVYAQTNRFLRDQAHVVEKVADKLDRELATLTSQFLETTGITGRAHFRGIQFVSRPRALEFQHACRRNRLLVRVTTHSGSVVQLLPPLSTTPDDVDRAMDAAFEALIGPEEGA
jgi:4-aminobutyrate aminotransferase-like enzyme